MTPRPGVRLLHTSDVHLGAYDHGGGGGGETERRRERLHGQFSRAIDAGIEADVDFVVIAGDFIDNARVRDETLRFAAAELARAGVPVVLAPGNHDHVGPGSVYDRLDFAAMAPNVQIMRAPEGETVSLAPLEVEVWGRSHTEQDPRFSPFGDPPRRGDAAWQVAVGHGHFIHPAALLQHSFHIYEDHLAALDRDYVAIGHWERLVRVAAGDGTAAYCGAPESLGGGSTVGGRVLIVDLEPQGSVRLAAPSLANGSVLAHDEIPFVGGVDRA